MKRFCFAAASAALSCAPAPGPSPEALDVPVDIAGLDELAFDDPVRLTIMWTQSSRSPEPAVATFDTEVPDEGRLDARFALPPDEMMARATPTEPLSLDLRTVTSTLVHRPRVVVYRDGDRDARLDIDEGSADHILGVDGGATGVAAVLDLDGLLEELPLDASEAYYQLTQGHYTPFLGVGVSGGTIYSLDHPLPLLVELEEGPLARQLLLCGRPAVDWETMTITVVVDESLEEGLCGLFFSACTAAALEDFPRPDLAFTSLPSLHRESQCRHQNGLEALLILERTIDCDEQCLCIQKPTTQALVARETDVPSWWPCGSSLEFCESSLPLTSFASVCEPSESTAP